MQPLQKAETPWDWLSADSCCDGTIAALLGDSVCVCVCVDSNRKWSFAPTHKHFIDTSHPLNCSYVLTHWRRERLKVWISFVRVMNVMSLFSHMSRDVGGTDGQKHDWGCGLNMMITPTITARLWHELMRQQHSSVTTDVSLGYMDALPAVTSRHVCCVWNYGNH